MERGRRKLGAENVSGEGKSAVKYLVFAIAALGVPPLAWLLSLNARWMRHAFWGMALANIPVAYAYAAAIVYGSAIYVLLRRSVDGTPFDACALNLKGSAPRKLRKILKDGKGAPTFDAQQASMTEKKTETSAEERSEQEEKI